MMELILQDRCLAVFIDDTGHEEFKGDSVYGLGGCATLGRDLERVVRLPWKEVRRRVTGSAETPLHANEFGRSRQVQHIEAISGFFQIQPFYRFGAIFSTETKLTDLSKMQNMKFLLQKRINDIVERTLCKEVIVVFESSQRADKLIQSGIGEFEFNRGSKHIPSQNFFMAKACADPALEVADFVVHAMGRKVRKNPMKIRNHDLDFKAVFNISDRNLVSYMQASSIEINK